MPVNTESLSDSARVLFLARLAHLLTICARDTYEVGTEDVLDPRRLRAYNEVLHRVTASVVSHLRREEGYSLESIIELLRSFGVDHDQTREVDWAVKEILKEQ
jgi:hypothetical protein